MSCQPTQFTLTGTVSIDKGPDAKFVLEDIKRRYTTHHLHGTRAEALNNCLHERGGASNIVGFGSEGIIVTGTGDEKHESSTFLSINNATEWKSDLKLLMVRESVTTLTLCACHTGAGQKGAQLVYDLATALNATVRAPTGLVFFDLYAKEFSLECNAEWQEASPSLTRPAAIASPTFYPAPFDAHQVLLMTAAGPRWFDRRSITSVRMQPRAARDTVHTLSTVPATPQAWPEEQVDFPLRYFALAEPFESHAVPLSIATSTLTLTFKSSNDSEEQRTMRVLEDGLLQDVRFPNIYYRANVPALSKAIEDR